MNKKTKYGAEARACVLGGIKKIADAVTVTLGPKGRNVLISQSMVIDYGVHSLPIDITKDGYKVTTKFDLDDPFEKAGVLMVKEAAQKTVDQAGDGTTTTCLLVAAITEAGIAEIEKGANPIEVKRGIDSAVDIVVEELKKQAILINGDMDKIRQIATVSANNDESIGSAIAEAFEEIGEQGIIDIEASESVDTEIKIAKGYKWGKSWVSPLFINNKEKQLVEFENPLILLYDKKINHHTQIQNGLEIAMKAGKSLLIICEDAVEEGLAFMVLNTIQGRVKCCVVKSPGFGEAMRIEMEDIALLTGGTYMSDLRGLDIKQIQYSDFGQAKKVIVTKDETIIIGGQSDKEGLETLLNELRMNLTQAKTEEEKFPIEKRIAKLTGGVAVISVGAATETEMKERLDRFDDAVRATKSAIAEGYVTGGGTVFAKIKTGNQIIDDALKAPFFKICQNAGVDPEPYYHNLKNAEPGTGYNAKTDNVEDLIQSGIIDPVKVLRCALQNAASSASMVLTCECLIVDTL